MEASVVTILDGSIEAFLLSCQVKGCSRLTVRTYDEALRRFRSKIDGDGDGDVQSLTTLRVQKYLSTLQAAGLKQVTVHKHYRAIRRFLAWCVESQLLNIHPLQHFHMKRPKTFPYVPRDDDVERLVKGCQDTPRDRRTKALTLLLADTGLRITEALRLHIEDVDLGLRSCTIREGKGQKPRVTFFGATTARVLRDYLTKREGAYREDFLFAADDGVPLSRFQAAWFLASLSRRVSLKRYISPHMLRHYFATAFLRAGGDMESLRQLLGHTTLEMTLRYVHMLKLDVARNYRRASPVDHMLR